MYLESLLDAILPPEINLEPKDPELGWTQPELKQHLDSNSMEELARQTGISLKELRQYLSEPVTEAPPAELDSAATEEPEIFEVRWTKRMWEDHAVAAGYQVPCGDSKFPGADIVQQLSLLLAKFLDDAEQTLGFDVPGETVDQQIAGFARLMEKYLDLGEELTKSAVTPHLNWHQHVHIQEISRNFVRTIIQLGYTVLGYPDKPSFEQRDKTPYIELHAGICGLLCSRDLVETSSSHQEARVPYSPLRVGQEVTYEEIANITRTSRVNVRRVERDQIYKHLRRKLKGFEDYVRD